MIFSTLTRVAGALVLAAGLSACVDVTMELEIVDTERGNGIITMSMDREFYDMSQDQGGGDFCDDGEVTVTEETATCVTIESGTFEELVDEDGGPAPTIVHEGGGLVRVTFPTDTLVDEFGEDSDPQTQAMMEQFFAGHFITLKISGGRIIDTNMEIAEDGLSASFVIPFNDLMSGDVDLPEQSFALLQL